MTDSQDTQPKTDTKATTKEVKAAPKTKADATDGAFKDALKVLKIAWPDLSGEATFGNLRALEAGIYTCPGDSKEEARLISLYPMLANEDIWHGGGAPVFVVSADNNADHEVRTGKARILTASEFREFIKGLAQACLR